MYMYRFACLRPCHFLYVFVMLILILPGLFRYYPAYFGISRFILINTYPVSFDITSYFDITGLVLILPDSFLQINQIVNCWCREYAVYLGTVGVHAGLEPRVRDMITAGRDLTTGLPHLITYSLLCSRSFSALQMKDGPRSCIMYV